MSRDKNLVGFIANCTECEAVFVDYNTAKDEARRHAISNKHTVICEKTTCFEYRADGRQY